MEKLMNSRIFVAAVMLAMTAAAATPSGRAGSGQIQRGDSS